MKDYDAELKKLAKQAAEIRKKKALAMKREDEQIGKIAREVFGEDFPEKLSDVKGFFESMKKNPESEPVTESTSWRFETPTHHF